MKNLYVDVAYAVLQRQGGGEPYGAAVGQLAQRLRPIIDHLRAMEQAELVSWLCSPAAEFEGKTPAEVIARGDAQAVSEFLQTSKPGRVP